MTPVKPPNELVLDFIKQTNQPIFLTGKAGTGKTTLLHQIKNTTNKNLAVVAPTAVAALNAGGVTLHSFFQIPFGPIVPVSANEAEADDTRKNSFAPEKIKLLRCLELLIIDEISMVRADVLDYVNRVLKQVNGSARPFGGVQVLMIGDLYQLPPVANHDWPVLRPYYPSPYFFDSQVFRTVPVITFELTKVYRQSDPTFINILNGIRNNDIDNTLLSKLNKRYDTSIAAADKEDYITLTTHNGLVGDINRQRLESLDAPVHRFKAVVTGDFPKDAYPADDDLQLKVGARVMFTKNDSSGKKQYYNGRTATITSIKGEVIMLRFLDDDSDFQIIPELWQNVKYALNADDQKITETNSGSFSQYPIKLAWAITIHKSQGLTFDKVVVDISAAFAHGQAYVALSRCRSLEGLILNAPVQQHNIITDPQVMQFMKLALNELPDQQLLERSVHHYERGLIDDLMDFSTVLNSWKLLGRLISTLQAGPLTELFLSADVVLTDDVYRVGNRFNKQEVAVLDESAAVTAQPIFLQRLIKAAGYFIPKVNLVITSIRSMVSAPWGNSLDEDKLVLLLDDCLSQLITKHALLKSVQDGFDTEQFLVAMRTTGISYKPILKPKLTNGAPLTHPRLYESLVNWRKELAMERKVLDHAIVAEKTLKLIAEKLPRSIEEVAAIKGIGKGKAMDVGSAVMRVINGYLGSSQLF